MPPIEEISVMDMIDEAPVAHGNIREQSSLPVKFFGLDHHPFSDNVNPQFFFRTEAHESAFIAMKRCIEEDVSLGLTTAVSGTGKTLLTQVLLQELDPSRYLPVLVLIYPGMSRCALLREVCDELRLEIPKTRPTTHELVSAIQSRIMELYVRGIKLVLIIDEVHFLNSENLQVLRTLSNIEIPEKKLITILLFGEEGFLKKLEHPTFKSILSRMYTRVRLRPLTRNEVEQYVKYRLLLVNGRTDIFSSECYPWLAEASRGIPREINRYCHNALQLAAETQMRRVTSEL
ncbi:AAA family ATPase, partial [bacterium]|nr:AAA family ATPase [bacterium]